MTAISLHGDIEAASSDGYRRAISHFASGVTIILTSVEGTEYGATASAVCSLSTDPAMLVVCLNRTSETGKAVRESGRLSVNILTENQALLASRFGSRKPDRFRDASLGWTDDGLPLLSDSLVTLDCRVEFAVDAATHIVFLCAVRQLKVREGKPLTYFRGRFGSFEAIDDTTLRERIVAVLRAEVSRPLDAVELARELDAQRAVVAAELRDLTDRGLVTETEGRYRAAAASPERTNHHSQENDR
ncbi:flavin reductase family protein [Streptomyces sp. NPDC000618]|uniref:flavin reductase family protein n=1 Tax=Streptomyces sp. NPDC000618 TaxID=3154265 RepID=UPI00331E6DFE